MSATTSSPRSRRPSPRRASSRSASSSMSRWIGRDGAAAGRWSSCWPTSATPATPAPIRARPTPLVPSAVVFTDGVGRPVQRQVCARARAGSLWHLPVVVGAALADGVARPCGRAGLQVLAADGGGARRPRRAARRRRTERHRPHGSSATRRGVCTERPASRSAIAPSASRSTAGPRASTSPRPRPSASTPARAPSALRLGRGRRSL